MFMVRHKCANGQALAAYLDDPDLLHFPVGTWGREMPSNTPFVVQSAEPCPACGKTVQTWFQWAGQKFWTP